MFEANLLDSSPERAAVLNVRHWVAGLGLGVLGSVAGYFGLPLVSAIAPRALLVESVLLGIGVMFYELMIWYVMADARRHGFGVWQWSMALLVLNLVGFVIYLIYSAAKTGDWKRATVPIAYMLEGVIVFGLLLLPLIHTQALPNFVWTVTPIPPLLPARFPAATSRMQVTRHAAPSAAMTPPVIIPPHIAMIKEETNAPPVVTPEYGLFPGQWPAGGDQNGISFGSTTGRSGPPPPPPVAPQNKKTGRIHVGGRVEEAKLMFHPTPEYPPLAKMARIQGMVLLQAIIGKDGTIQDLKAVSGHPLLVQAAMEAVARWRYQPTLLNGEPVEVVTEVEVKFILAD